MFRSLLLVGAGGFLGAVARFFLAMRIGRPPGAPTFPWAIFSVNMIGCLLIGVLAALFTSLEDWSGRYAASLFLIAGFLGSFTTFSTFGLDTLLLLRENRMGLAFFYAATSVIAGVALVALGYWIGGRLMSVFNLS